MQAALISQVTEQAHYAYWRANVPRDSRALFGEADLCSARGGLRQGELFSLGLRDIHYVMHSHQGVQLRQGLTRARAWAPRQHSSEEDLSGRASGAAAIPR